MIANTRDNQSWIRILAPQSKFVPFFACIVEKVRAKWLPYERWEVREELEMWEVAQELGN